MRSPRRGDSFKVQNQRVKDREPSGEETAVRSYLVSLVGAHYWSRAVSVFVLAVPSWGWVGCPQGQGDNLKGSHRPDARDSMHAHRQRGIPAGVKGPSG